jgi:hypothetical protein
MRSDETFSLTIDVVPDNLAEGIAWVQHGESNDQYHARLIDLVNSVDGLVGEWPFTLKLIASMLPDVVAYAEDEDEPELKKAAESLSGHLAAALKA